MNFLSLEDDFTHYFTICEPKVVFIDPSLYGIVFEALKRFPSSSRAEIICLVGTHPNLLSVSQTLVELDRRNSQLAVPLRLRKRASSACICSFVF